MPEKSFIHDKKDKAWWDNFWYYYKIHVIVGIIVLGVVVYSVSECVNKVNPDLSVCYIGGKYFNDTVTQNINETFSQYVTDVDGRHGSVASFYQINLSKDPKNEQAFAMQQRAMLEVAAGDAYLYILDEEVYKAYLEEGIFANIAEGLGKTGEVYGVPLKNSTLISSIGVDNSNLYAAVREVRDAKKKNAKEQAKKENAISVVKELEKSNQ